MDREMKKKEMTWMKSLFVKLGVVLIGLAIFSYVEVWGADWKFFSKDDEFICFYDNDGLTRSSSGVVRVQIKFEATEQNLLAVERELGLEEKNIRLGHKAPSHKVKAVNFLDALNET